MLLVLSEGEHLLIAYINLHSDGRHLVQLRSKANYQLSKLIIGQNFMKLFFICTEMKS